MAVIGRPETIRDHGSQKSSTRDQETESTPDKQKPPRDSKHESGQQEACVGAQDRAGESKSESTGDQSGSNNSKAVRSSDKSFHGKFFELVFAVSGKRQTKLNCPRLPVRESYVPGERSHLPPTMAHQPPNHLHLPTPRSPVLPHSQLLSVGCAFRCLSPPPCG